MLRCTSEKSRKWRAVAAAVVLATAPFINQWAHTQTRERTAAGGKLLLLALANRHACTRNRSVLSRFSWTQLDETHGSC